MAETEAYPLGGELLARFPMTRTYSPEVAREAFSRISHVRHFDLPKGSEGFFGQLNYARVHGIELAYCFNGAELAVHAEGRPQFRQQICLSGSAVSKLMGTEVELASGRSCIIPPEIDVASHTGSSYRQILLRLDFDSVVTKLTALIGSSYRKKLEFSPHTAVNDPHQERLMRAVLFLAKELDLGSVGCDMSDLAKAEFAQWIIVLFLLGGRHNYEIHLQGKAPDTAPRQVRLATEYIEANWNKPISIEDLAIATNASARSLFKTFKQNRSCSPMAFVKQVRLAHARRMLSSGDPAVTVTGVAFACGFHNVGHFAADYRRTFGELPSQTILRAK